MVRIVSLTPATTEILFALGLGPQVVGDTSYCNYPPEAKKKEKIGDFSQPNIEKIVSLRPDIIFATGLEQAAVVRKLRNLGQKVIVVDPGNFGELFTDLKRIGELTHKQSEAERLTRKMKTEIQKIRNKSASSKSRPRVFVEICANPLMTAGKGSFLDELISVAGGVNVAGDIKRSYTRISEEFVIKANPEVIILLDKTTPEQIKNRPGWGNISALKKDKVFADLNPDILTRPGPRLTEGLKELFKAMNYEP